MKPSTAYSPSSPSEVYEHFKRNILTYVKVDHKQQVAEELREVFLTGQNDYSPKQAREKFDEFAERWGGQYKDIKKLGQRENLHYYFTYLDYDRRIQSMLPATN